MFHQGLDGTQCETLRQQNIGKYRGLTHLFYFLDQRKENLLTRIKQPDNDSQPNQE